MPPDPRWNETNAVYPDKFCIHELFEEQAARTPDTVALIDGENQYTYAELNTLTNQIARFIRQNYVSNESIVGCYLTRSSAIVILTLAILKAGGCYILLDALTPKPRLNFILSEAEPVLIIFDDQITGLEVGGRTKSLTFQDIRRFASSQSGDNLSLHLSNTNTAYIAFTSGSTGRPKGVVITHKSTVNHAYAFSKLFKLSSKDRVPIMAPIGFDMAIEEMIPPLISGCTLIVSKSKFIVMEDFNQEIEDNSYTILNLPVPVWLHWSEYLLANRLAIPQNVRIVIAGSEAIEVKIFKQWKNVARASNVWWVAAYGTTETTITSTFYTTAYADKLEEEPFIPIGKPIANTYAYILDEALQPLPIGKEGELYIGGQGVARGYFHHEGLTKERFISNPFIHERDERIYKTGDLARYRSDGTIVWLGRSDSQIKLYGLRIEPGEIEAILQHASFIKESVVVLRQRNDPGEDKQLVAFITIEPNKSFNEAEVRQLIFHNLPTLMAPHKYIVLPELPLNSNGKIDRKVLESYSYDQ